MLKGLPPYYLSRLDRTTVYIRRIFCDLMDNMIVGCMGRNILLAIDVYGHVSGHMKKESASRMDAFIETMLR